MTAAGPPGAASYPQHWEADIVLTDGGVAHLRPVSPQDTEALRAMHSRMSERTKYLRYFSVVPQVTPQLLAVFTDVDYVGKVGLVVELGGEIIAAATYHVDGKGTSAEVAFLVEDAHQGRGLGSILLEHLAAAAQERGIPQFTAEVLAENQGMVRVFLDAGYAVQREYDSGVVEVAFDIAPTVASREVTTSREQRAEARSIARLLTPASVAVIGASDEPTKLGHAVLLNLLRGGFTGPVYPVNPDTRSVQGVRAYASVTDIPDPVDLAVVTVPAASVAEVVESCRAKGVHGLVVMTAGFADAGESGASAQRHMVALARANGMRVIGPNCLGLVNTSRAVRLNGTLAPVVPPPGRVGFFCQSGALGIAILADAAGRGLGLSSFVSAGNRADVSGNDLLQYWQSDDRTEVVLLYLESFGNPRKFARLARALARTKPVIAVKSGRHALVSPGLAANATVMSETAVATLFAQSGVIRTASMSEAFDVAQLLATQPVPAGRRVAIVGNSTALGVLALDACVDAGLEVADGAPADLGCRSARRSWPARSARRCVGTMSTPSSWSMCHRWRPRASSTLWLCGTPPRTPRSLWSVLFSRSTGCRSTWPCRVGRAEPDAGRCRPTARPSWPWRRWPTRCATVPGGRVRPGVRRLRAGSTARLPALSWTRWRKRRQPTGRSPTTNSSASWAVTASRWSRSAPPSRPRRR